MILKYTSNEAGVMEYVQEAMDERTKLEQLAEEAAELSQAALKMIRARGFSDSPTPVGENVARNKILEELTDVLICADLIGAYVPDDVRSMKLDRLGRRLGYTEDGRWDR